MNQAAVVITNVSLFELPIGLEQMRLSNPALFEKFVRRVANRPQHGTISLSFVDGRLAHIKTEITDR